MNDTNINDMSIIIQEIPLTHILMNKDLYNVNNLRPPEITPEIYTRWVNNFSFENWYKLLLDAKLVYISDIDKQTLISLARKSILIGKKVTNEDIEDFTPSFISNIEIALQAYNYKVFVKTSEKSGKNDSKICPAFSILDVIQNIVNSKDVYLYSLMREDQCKYLIIQPWRSNITLQNEFRVIVEDYRIKGISQQRLYQNVDLSKELVLRAGESILKWYDTNKSLIPYSSTVLDVFVDFTNDQTELIECNPGYSWGSSGSSLFHWENDKNLLDDSNVYIRYVS